MLKATFSATFIYKSGAKHTVHGLSKLKTHGGTWEWDCLGRDRIFHLGVDNIESVHLRHNGYIVDSHYFLRNIFYTVGVKLIGWLYK
jgi:hypothetical protein